MLGGCRYRTGRLSRLNDGAFWTTHLDPGVFWMLNWIVKSLLRH